jgi:hypothetical protein
MKGIVMYILQHGSNKTIITEIIFHDHLLKSKHLLSAIGKICCRFRFHETAVTITATAIASSCAAIAQLIVFQRGGRKYSKRVVVQLVVKIAAAAAPPLLRFS